MLVEVSLLPESGFEVALVAEFGDDVAVAIAGEDLEAFEDIGVAQLLQDVDFREKKLLKFFALEGLELDDLDGYDFGFAKFTKYIPPHADKSSRTSTSAPPSTCPPKASSTTSTDPKPMSGPLASSSTNSFTAKPPSPPAGPNSN